MRVLLLSAYAAQSHRYWQRGLRAMFPDWEWRELELPPRYFSWRVRGNPLHWSLAERPVLEARYDLLIATSMVDLATLRGLVPALARVPSLVYFHENQFDYPQDRQRHNLLEAQMVSLYSALAADRLAFNSAYNRESFLAGLTGLLARLPDFVPDGVVQSLAEKSEVLPVPILPPPEPAGEGAVGPWPARGGTSPMRILWSARFEHDKGGDRLLAILRQLEAAGLDYQLALTGPQFRGAPPEFAQMEQEFAHRLVQFGFVESEAEYRAWQRGADVILSTALHEFQGLAVMEAVSLGCVPVVPDRLAYRDFYPARYRYACDTVDVSIEVGAAAAMLLGLDRGGLPGAPDISPFGVVELRGPYAKCLAGLAAAG